MDSDFCCIIVILWIVFIILPVVIYAKYKDYNDMIMPRHRLDHHGLVKDTRYGKKDIYCPKCKSPYTMYHTTERVVTPVRVRTKTKIHPLNPFKPFAEDITTISGGNEYEFHRYRCRSCGHVFSA